MGVNEPTDDGDRLGTPSARLGETIGALDDMERALMVRVDLLRRVNELTGLCFGELQALAVVAAGGTTAGAVADATGQVPAAADATIESLRERGMVEVGEAAGPATPVTVTAQGKVAVQRAEGVQVRLMDDVVSALTPEETGRLRSVLRATPDPLPGRGPRPVP